MQRQPLRAILVAILLAISLSFLGCDDEDCPIAPPAETGTVLISVLPDSIQAPWTLHRPDQLLAVGLGDSVLTEMPVGDYSIDWQAVGNWYPPLMPMVVDLRPLAAGDTLVFAVQYVYSEEPAGVAAVRIEPSWLDASWVLSGPDGFVTDGTHGSLDWQNLGAGDYTITWGAVDGWQTPDAETLALAEGDTITFTGVYVEEPVLTGMIRVNPEPDEIEAGWTLTGPEDFALSGTGDMLVGNLAPGEYAIVWDEVALWNKPVDNTLTLDPDMTAEFLGLYTSFLTNPDVMMENFVTMLETESVDTLQELMVPAFRLNILQETMDEWAGGDNPLGQDYFDAATFAAINENIFGGEVGVDPLGNPVPPVASIEVAVMSRLAPWEAVSQSVEYFGEMENAYVAPFDVVINFNLMGNVRFQVDGMIQFYADGTGGIYHLLGIQPVAPYSGQKTESVTYDGVLALYR